MKEVLTAIEKYDGRDDQDLILWQHKVRMYLSTKDLDQYIEAPINDQSLPVDKRSDKKAKSVICTCLTDTLLDP